MELQYINKQSIFFISTINPKVDFSHSSLIISNKIPSIPHFGFKWNINKKIKFHYFHGRLKSSVIDSTMIDIMRKKSNEIDRYFAFHQIQYTPNQFIEIRGGEIVVYGNRGIELGYTLPFIPFWSMQHFLGDLDNIQWNLISIIKPINSLKLYNVFLMDEFRPGLVFEKNNRNWVAYQFGIIKDNIFGYTDKFQIEYSWTDHRMYRHRFQINDFYSHDYSLGFWAGPHAEELFLSYKFSMMNTGFELSLSKAKRGELSEQMIIDQYATVYYERFNGISEEKSIFTIQVDRVIFENINVSIGVKIIDWENAGFDPFNNNSIDELMDIKKSSINFSLGYKFD
jgi:hypothetical protein